jgi:hypothetical protein
MGRKYRERMKQNAARAPLWIRNAAMTKPEHMGPFKRSLGTFGPASSVRQLSQADIDAYNAELRSKRRGGEE